MSSRDDQRAAGSTLPGSGQPLGPTRLFRGLPGHQTRGEVLQGQTGEEIRTPADKATVFVHRPHHHGHTPVPTQKTNPERHLRIYNDKIPLLQGEISRLAELHKAQLVFERLLHKNPKGTR